jgi:rhodanese-related sulfurtransferase
MQITEVKQRIVWADCMDRLLAPRRQCGAGIKRRLMRCVDLWAGGCGWALMLALLFLPYLAMAQESWEAPPLLEGTIKISAEELLDIKAEFKDVVIIDTRPNDTSDSLSIEGAITVADQTFSPHTLAALTKDKFTPLVIFGADAHSIHSYKAARQAVAMGYTYVFWFRGGLKEWLDKGMPVVGLQK